VVGRLSNQSRADVLAGNGHRARYSLIKVAGDGLSTHRLLQAVIREDLDPDAQQWWATTATALLQASFPRVSGDVHTWPDCQ